ncbi:MAG TPA: thioredoxin domain-containing protein [Pirellulales bacterium]|jgi:protein disulfide-isomerase
MYQRRFALSAALVVLLINATFCTHARATAAPEILWQTDLEVAKRIASQTNRMVLVHFWSPSCGPCKLLEKDVFSQPQVQQAIQSRFVPVKLNADDWPTTVKAYGVTRLPTDLVLTPNGQIIGRMVSPLKPDAYLQELAIAANGTGPAATPPGAAFVASTAISAPMGTAAAPPVATAPQAQTTPNGNILWGAPPTAGQAAAPITAAPIAAVPPAMPNYSNDRYAEFQQRFGHPAPVPAAQQSVNPVPQYAAQQFTVPPQAGAPQQAATASYAAAPYQTSPVAAPTGYAMPNQQMPVAGYAPANQAFASGQPQSLAPAAMASPYAGYAAPAAAPQIAPPPVGLNGYCPVTLIEQHRWQVGDQRFGAVHRGRTYLFAGPEEQRKFLANPDRYSPAASGHDVVAAIEYGQEIDGQRALGVEYANRIYLFSSDATRQMFMANRDRYAAQVLQAESPTGTTLR